MLYNYRCNISIHNCINTNNYTQSQSICLHKVGEGSRQDGTKLKKYNKYMSEVTIEVSQCFRSIGIPTNGGIWTHSNTFPTQIRTLCVIFRVFPELSSSFCNPSVHGHFHNNTRIVTVASKAAEMPLFQLVTRIWCWGVN